MGGALVLALVLVLVQEQVQVVELAMADVVVAARAMQGRQVLRLCYEAVLVSQAVVDSDPQTWVAAHTTLAELLEVLVDVRSLAPHLLQSLA